MYFPNIRIAKPYSANLREGNTTCSFSVTFFDKIYVTLIPENMESLPSSFSEINTYVNSKYGCQ